MDRVTARTTLVTIGIGGNDAGLIPLAHECLEAGLANRSCKAAHVRAGVDDTVERFTDLGPKIEAAIQGVRARAATNVRILVVNYLEAVPDDGRGCYPTVPVRPVDAAWFSKKFKLLNATLANAAKKQHAQLVDTYTPTIGHNACAGPTTRYVELVGGPSSNPAFSLAAPMHPNIAGADAQTRIVAAAIDCDQPRCAVNQS